MEMEQIEANTQIPPPPSRNLHASSITRVSEDLELVFQDLEYTVPLEKKYQKPGRPKTKKILTGITAAFRPGRLTAIMGSSGAGKTTLLTVLAGNAKTGTVEGKVLVNGEPFSGRMLKEISGFVFQDDVLLPTMTVKEAVQMSALLRLPKSVSREERTRRVDDTISLLHLDHARDTQVGSPLQKGISGGERKRTAIGMELVINPAMLFLDEPTTGLDTFTAFTVILSLSRLAKQGRTVVATIHQPSTEIFGLFDDLLILSRGRVAYFGPTEDVVSYFEKQGFPCPRYSNPADFIFMDVLREFGSIGEDDDDDDEEEEEDSEVSETTPMIQIDPPKDGAGTATTLISPRTPSVTGSELEAAGTGQVEATMRKEPLLPPIKEEKSQQEQCDERITKLLGTWKESDENAQVMDDCKNPIKKGVAVGMLRKRAPLLTQFKYLFKRSGKNLIRNRLLVISRFAQAIFLGLVLGLVYLDSNQYSVPVQIRNKSGALFFIAVNLFFSASTQILSIFGTEKPVFYREYVGGYYTASAYYISKTMVEIPGQIIGPYLMVIICYYMIGLNPAFSNYLMIATLGALASLCGNAYGTFIASVVDDVVIALTLAPLLILPLLVVSGIFVAALPVYINWMKYISPIYYAFSGMLQTEFTRTFPNCNADLEICSGDRAITELEFSDTFSPGVNIAFLVMIYVILWIAGFIALKLGAKRKS